MGEMAEDRQAFLRASAVYSSPLTRAVQTCLLALQGHPALQAGPVRLLSCAREVNKVGGLDSVGIAFGKGIETRVFNELNTALGEAEASSVISRLDPYSCSNNEWWTRGGSAETKPEIHSRLTQLLNTMISTPGESCILVGHSLLFVELLRECSCAQFAKDKPDAVARLGSIKLANAACLAIDLRASSFTGETEIVDAKLMFGSHLEDGFGFDQTLPLPKVSEDSSQV